jgi:hypothetical protein
MEQMKLVAVAVEHLPVLTVVEHSAVAAVVTDATVTAQVVAETMVLVVKEKEADLVQQVVRTSNTTQVRH